MSDREDFIATLQACYIGDINALNKIVSVYDNLQQKNKQLKEIRESAINYIDQVLMYKPCAREMDEELNTLIGILRGRNNE